MKKFGSLFILGLLVGCLVGQTALAGESRSDVVRVEVRCGTVTAMH